MDTDNDDNGKCLTCGGSGYDYSSNHPDGMCLSCFGNGHVETPDEWDERMGLSRGRDLIGWRTKT